ncbi:ATP-binding protein [Microcystis aeruginosa FACHB-524]|uniref:ATP-binding protein n=1 Tax=Microcystis aeruginosa TaxID=1126 RepID=UPI000F4573D4|nr:ATP-binding protein [Microcystis aeruginosa]ROI10202.1 ATP-binding protein [Microcystis aeruginosa FACHB-524]
MPRYDKINAFLGEETQNNTPPTEFKTVETTEKDSNNSGSVIELTNYLREPKYTLNDVILPENTKKQVELILAEMEYQNLIYQEWGMAEKHKLDKALSINFSGLPGTGKTLTAEALAYELKLKILDVPYEQIESKFVGETPKNIRAAFDFATESNAVLFFDEADSFLGKRLENVTQATDTAVNLTRSVMIKQLSAYQGIVIFATNLIRNYDPAFISRIRWKVQFNLPTEEARSLIWQVQIPDKLPLDDSVDFVELAKRFDGISGRDIKNAVLQGVVAAAREDKAKQEKRVTQAHLTEAITEIIEGNKASYQEQVTLTPVEGEVSLPKVPNNNSRS